jgi:hypothetical protein
MSDGGNWIWDDENQCEYWKDTPPLRSWSRDPYLVTATVEHAITYCLHANAVTVTLDDGTAVSTYCPECERINYDERWVREGHAA